MLYICVYKYTYICISATYEAFPGVVFWCIVQPCQAVKVEVMPCILSTSLNQQHDSSEVGPKIHGTIQGDDGRVET